MTSLFLIIGIVSWITSFILYFRELRNKKTNVRWINAIKFKIEGYDAYLRLLSIIQILGLFWTTTGLLLFLLPNYLLEGDIEIVCYFFGLIIPIGIGISLIMPRK